MILALVAAILTLSAAPSSAAPGTATPELPSKAGLPAGVQSGGLIQYTINYTCSNNDNDGDGCDGSVFRDPIPKFTDVYGNQIPLEFVGATGPASVWPAGFTVDESDPANPAIVSTAGIWPAGASGSIFVALRVPANMVPAGTQTIVNQATVTDPDDGNLGTSPEATNQITGSTPEWAVSKDGPGTGTRLNRDYEWRISVCGPATSAVYPIFEITDTLPEGFQFTSAEYGGTFVDDAAADGISQGAATVNWTFDADNRPPLGSDGCFRMKVKGRFPSADPTNVDGAEKTDVATGIGKNLPGDDGVGIGTAPWTTTLVGPVDGTIGTSKSFTDVDSNESNFYVAAGDTGQFNLSASADSDFLLDRVVLTDGQWTLNGGSRAPGLPDTFTATSIDPGTWNDPVTATIYGSNDDFTTSTAIANGVASDAADITLGSSYRSFRWEWDGPGANIRGDFAASGLAIVGSITNGTEGVYVNVSRLDVTPDGRPVLTGEGSDNYFLEQRLPHPDVTKRASSTSRQPGQNVTYTLQVGNSRDATGNLVNPEITDCVPANLNVDALSITAPSPWTADPAGTCGPGGTGTRLHFTWVGTLTPGQTTSNITYVVQVAPSDPGPPAPFGTYPNTATVGPSGGGSFAHCVDTNPSCGETVTVVVQPTVELNSQKCVRGELDDGVFRPTPRCTLGESALTPAITIPGGEIVYRLELTNQGNTDAENVDFIDLLPRVGDTSVISTTGGVLNQRRSEYAPILVAPITPPAGWTVSYSTSVNPCRPEVGIAAPGCEAPNWTTIPDELALASYKALKFSRAGVLAMGQSASFQWTMRAPATDPTYDAGGSDGADPNEFLQVCDLYAATSDANRCPRAVNSFGYGADAANLPQGIPQPQRLYAEPPQVEVRVAAPSFANSIGDRVWFDRNYDGIQDDDTTETGEPGVAGARVELWEEGGTEPLAVAYTNATGNYLFNSIDPDGDGTFSAIPDGAYFVRFYPPAGWSVSPEGIGDDATDSDVPRSASGMDAIGGYHDSPVTTLGDDLNVDIDDDGTPDGEADPTWDLGLWRALPEIDIDKVTRDTAWDESDAGDGVNILQGRPVTWSYTISNTGNSRLEDVVVTDDGGPNESFTVTDCEITDDGANADGLASSASAPMALNRGAVMTCTATGIASTTDYENLATVVGTSVLDDGTELDGDPVGAEDLSSYAADAYDLALTKVLGSSDLASGEVTYTITVENQGDVNSGDFTVTDVLPDGMSYASSTPTPTTQTATVDAGPKLTWDLTDLEPTERATITLTAQIDDFLAGPFRNHAEISADGSASLENNGVATPTSDVDSTPEDEPTNVTDDYYGTVGDPDATDNNSITEAGVGPDAEDDEDIADYFPEVSYDLALAKVADATALTADDDATITYTVTVENQGNVPSGTYQVTDTLAPGLTPDLPIAGGGTYDEPSHTVTWTGTNLAPAGQATFTVVANVTDLTKRAYRNHAEISSDSARALYGVDDVDSAPDADVTDDNDDNGITEGNGYGPIGNPATGGVDNITIDDAGTGTDGEDDADIADVDLPLTGAYDLALAKTVDSATVAYDGTITYTVTIQNQGILDSREVEVTDVVPDGLAIVGLGSAVDNGDGTVTWTIDNLEPGETVTRTLTVVVDDITKRPFRNFAEISSDSADYYSVDGEEISDVDSTPDADTTNDGDYGPIGSLGPIDNVDGDQDAIAGAGEGEDPGDDADIADVDVPVTYDLALLKQGPALIDVDGTATFTITVKNEGNVPSGVYDVTDLIPDGMAAIGSDDDATISDEGDQVTWTGLPSLAPGEETNLTVTVEITDLTKRPFTNFAEITADSADGYSTPDETVTDVDSVPGDDETSGVDVGDFDESGTGDDVGFDDEDIATIDTEVVYDLALVKTVDRPTIGYDGTATFTVTVLNQGNVPSGPVTVTDDVPAGLTALEASNSGTIADDGATVTWTDLSLDPGEQIELTLSVSIADITKRPFRNFAEITEDGADGYSTPDETVTDVDSVPGDDETSDVDNTTIDESGTGDDVGFDDEDIAVLDSPVSYDLALVKRLLPGQRYKLGDVVRYEIEVTNEGNVPSLQYSVSDTLPAGMAFVEGSNGARAVGQDVIWTDLESLEPGASAVLTVSARLTDVGRPSYVNTAQVTDDGADEYSTDTETVTDVDSVPDKVQGEDDEDQAEIDVSEILSDNQPNEPRDPGTTPGPGNLPRTGLALGGLLLAAGALLLAGGAFVSGSRRRRLVR